MITLYCKCSINGLCRSIVCCLRCCGQRLRRCVFLCCLPFAFVHQGDGEKSPRQRRPSSPSSNSSLGGYGRYTPSRSPQNYSRAGIKLMLHTLHDIMLSHELEIIQCYIHLIRRMYLYFYIRYYGIVSCGHVVNLTVCISIVKTLIRSPKPKIK